MLSSLNLHSPSLASCYCVRATFFIFQRPSCLLALENWRCHLLLQISSSWTILVVSVGLCSLRVGVAFTGISGDTMEIQTLGKSERFVKPHWLTKTFLKSNIFFGQCWHEFNSRLFASVRYKLLHVLEFDANRRRMSVILQTPSGNYTTPENVLKLYIYSLCMSFTFKNVLLVWIP